MPPGYRPADLLEDPQAFGHDPNAVWKSDTAASTGRVGAARLQHRLACAIRTVYPANHARRLAELLGQSERIDYLRRKLNGQIPITLTELFEWLAVLGPDVAAAAGIDPGALRILDTT